MRHALSTGVFVLVVLSLLLPQASIAASARDRGPKAPFVAGEVLIGWEPGNGPVPQVSRKPGRLETGPVDPDWQAAAATVTAATGLAVIDAAPEYGMARLAVPPGSEAAEIERLKTLPWVRYAEPNYYAHAAGLAARAGAAVAQPAAGPYYPNDPNFQKQWNLQRVKAQDAWPLTLGSVSLIVAVLDTGVATGHPEFAGQLVDPVFWRNYITGQTGPSSVEDDDVTESHGTHVTGIVAARMNNATGVTGLAPSIKILPQKVLDDQGNGPYYAISGALRGAADRGAQVINASFSGPDATSLRDAVVYAQSRGVLVVAAAGNCAQNPGCSTTGQLNVDQYPAGYPGVMAVSASDRYDRPAIYSGFKPYISLAAPGGTDQDQVWSTTRTGYGWLYGTSMSAPVVSAAAALVWTLRPAGSASQVADILRNTADKVGSDPYSGQPLSYAGGRNDYFGSGRLNAGNAVRYAFPPSLAADQTQFSILLGGRITSTTRSVDITNPSGQEIYWQATVLAGAPWLSVSTPDGRSSYGHSARLTFAIDSSKYNGVPGLIRVQPVDPLGLAPLDVRVDLSVSGTLSATYAPAVWRSPAGTWLDPDAPGSLYRNTLTPASDGMLTLALPFAAVYYGAYQQLIQVAENGFVIFGAPSGSSGAVPATCPGNALPPNNAIYVLAKDWNLSAGGQIIVHRPDANTYVVTWRDVRQAPGGLPQSFQLVIGSGGTFRANYRTVEAPLTGIVGAENYDSIFSQQVLCNGVGQQISSGESVEFPARLPW